jgi:DnaK suppressor protein
VLDFRPIRARRTGRAPVSIESRLPLAKKTTPKKPSAKAKPSSKPKSAGAAKARPSKVRTSKPEPEKKPRAAAAKPAPKKAPAKPAKAAKPSAPRASGRKGDSKSAQAGAGRTVAAAAAASTPDAHGYVIIHGRRVRAISTKGMSFKKRPKATVVSGPSAEEQAAAIRAIKTKLSKKELDHYRDLLRIKRAELSGLISSMEAEALRSSGGNLSHVPIHMADVGSDTYDQDFKLGMAETERQLITEIDGALERIENKTYGVCQMTGKPIPKARLEAKPWAKYSIEAARLIESGRYR